jgi:hypothetical protein
MGLRGFDDSLWLSNELAFPTEEDGNDESQNSRSLRTYAVECMKKHDRPNSSRGEIIRYGLYLFRLTFIQAYFEYHIEHEAFFVALTAAFLRPWARNIA